jgi:dipeptidase
MEMAPGRDGTGGYWAAQRVPDDQIAWCSNNNIIRKVLKESRGHAFQDLSSGINTYEHITCNKLWADFDPMTQEPWLDFAKCVTSRNEYNHPYYSLRRRWRALSLCAPSLNLSPECEDGFHEYPFAVTPDKLLTLKDIFKIYRDRYEGTEFDLTKKGVIDPFNNPNRYNTAGKDASGDVGTSTPEGAWERSICWYYTDISWVCVPDKRDKKTGLDAMCWVSLNVPGEAPFVPLAIGPIPDSYKKISTKIFDEKKAFWTYNRVAEECYRKYCFIKPEVQKMIDFTEGKSFHFLTQLQDDPRVCNVIGTVNHEAEEIRKEWDKFWRKLVAKYNQGFRLSKFDPNKPWTGEWV